MAGRFFCAVLLSALVTAAAPNASSKPGKKPASAPATPKAAADKSTGEVAQPVGPRAGSGERSLAADDKQPTPPPSEESAPSPPVAKAGGDKKPRAEERSGRPAHQRGRAPRRPASRLPAGAEASAAKPAVRRGVAGGATRTELAAGTDDPELRALREAERVLFPRPLDGAVAGFRWGGSEDGEVVDSGLPPDGRLTPRPGGEDRGVTAEWIRSLTLPNLPVRLEARVVRYLKFYRDNPRGRAIARVWARKSGRLAPALKAEFAKAGLPTDLVWLSLIESGHNPTIRSPAGAAGLWQFMPESGRMYGLTVDRWVDERLDPTRSTEAAIMYLSDLHRRFGNWELAMAAYNMGHGGLSRAIQKFNSNDFWELCRYEAGIPWETTLYVPKIMAIAVVMNNKKAFGIADVTPDAAERFEAVIVESATSLDHVARVGGVSEKTLTQLNPQLLAGRVPPVRPGQRSERFRVRVPVGTGAGITARLAQSEAESARLSSHVVKLGDTLDSVARNIGSDAAVLKTANRVGDDETLAAGTVLVVPRSARKDSAAPASPDVVVVPPRRFDYPDRERVFYIVRSGDTVNEIAKTFGVARGDVEAWNALDSSARLQPSMTLQLWVKKEALPSDARFSREAEVRVLVAGTPEFIDYYEGLGGKKRLTVAAREGETLASIGRRYGLSSGWMERINRKSRRKKLHAGEMVVVYVPKSTPDPTRQDSGLEPLRPATAPEPEALPAVQAESSRADTAPGG